MFANVVVTTPEDLNSHVLASYRHALQLPSPPGPKSTPHWPTSHFVQLKIGRRQDATVVTYEVYRTPQGLGRAPEVLYNASDTKQALRHHRKPML